MKTCRFAITSISFFVFITIAALAVAEQAEALTIVLAPGPPGTTSQDIWMSFNALDGTALNGQAQSLDFVFADQKWIATRTDTLDAHLSIYTNAGTYPGFLRGTGYLFDSANNDIGVPCGFGSAAGSNGQMDAGLFPANRLNNPLIFYGVHFDLTYPVNPSVTASGEYLRLIDYGNHGAIGVNYIPSVPEPSTMLLVGSGLIGLVGFRRKFKK